MPDTRPNLQAKQDGIVGDDVNDKNGWPTPLTDPSNPLRFAVTHGSSGEQRNFDPVATSRQNDVSAPGGKSSAGPGDMNDQGGHGNKLQTSQQNVGDHHTVEG